MPYYGQSRSLAASITVPIPPPPRLFPPTKPGDTPAWAGHGALRPLWRRMWVVTGTSVALLFPIHHFPTLSTISHFLLPSSGAPFFFGSWEYREQDCSLFQRPGFYEYLEKKSGNPCFGSKRKRYHALIPLVPLMSRHWSFCQNHWDFPPNPLIALGSWHSIESLETTSQKFLKFWRKF